MDAASQTDTVRVRGLHASCNVAASDVYFTFPSGSLTYDCMRCGYQCCRGHGYLLGKAELLYQIELRPHIRVFIDAHPRTGSNPELSNFPPACFFLQSDGRCGVQVDKGYAAKPETCRLFPFNAFRLVGTCLVVAPHPRLCPLQIASPALNSELSVHSTLLADLCRAGIGSPVARCAGLVDEPHALIAFERKIVGLSDECLRRGHSVSDFVAIQLRMTQEFLVGRTDVAGDAVDQTNRALEWAARLLGVARADLLGEDELTRQAILATAGSLRAELVFQVPSTSDRVPEPYVCLADVPRLILATYVLARCARLAGLADINAQTVMRLFADSQALIWLLAHSDIAMTWRSDERVDIRVREHERSFQSPFVKLVTALLRQRHHNAPAPLGAVLLEHGVSAADDGLSFLRFLSKRLHRRLTPLGTGVTGKRPVVRLGVAFQQWLLSLLSDSVVNGAAGRIPRLSVRDDATYL